MEREQEGAAKVVLQPLKSGTFLNSEFVINRKFQISYSKNR